MSPLEPPYSLEDALKYRSKTKPPANLILEPKIELVKVGNRIWFEGEKQAYRVRARSARFLVCTKPFNPKHTVLYTVVDLVEKVRGTENLVFGMGAETDEQCQQMIERLEGNDARQGFTRSEVSHRNRVPLVVTDIK